MLPSAPGSGHQGQRWSEVKVQDVSHRTGQGVGHTLVEVTEKHKYMVARRGRRSGKQGVGHTLVEVAEEHKYMVAGRGRRSRSHNQKKRENVEGEKGAARGRMLQRVTRETRVGEENGGTWNQEKVKSRGGNCEGKRQFRGEKGKEAESIPLKRKKKKKKTEPK